MAINTKQRMRQFREQSAIRASLESNSTITSDVETLGGQRIHVIDQDTVLIESLSVSEANPEVLEEAGLESHRLDAVKEQVVQDKISEVLTPRAEISPTLVGHQVFVTNIGGIEDPKVQELLNDGLQAVTNSPDQVSMAVIYDENDPRLASLPENLREVVKSTLDHPEVAVLPNNEVLPGVLKEMTSIEGFRQAISPYKQK